MYELVTRASTSALCAGGCPDSGNLFTGCLPDQASARRSRHAARAISTTA